MRFNRIVGCEIQFAVPDRDSLIRDLFEYEVVACISFECDACFAEPESREELNEWTIQPGIVYCPKCSMNLLD